MSAASRKPRPSTTRHEPGDNSGYPETSPRDREDAQRPAPPPHPSPDEPGIGHDPDAQPDPAKHPD